MSASETTPDIFEIQSSDLSELCIKNILLNLDEYIANSKDFQRDDLFDKALNSFQFDGKMQGKGSIYGMAKDWSPTWCILYNKNLFDRCGVPHLTKSLTWDELLAIARKLTKRNSEGGVEHLGIYIQTHSQTPLDSVAASQGLNLSVLATA